MTNMFLLAARRVTAALFPSVPYADRARILAAMSDPYPSTPVSGLRGEAQPEAGEAPVAGTYLDPDPATGPQIPRVEDLRNWRPDGQHRYLFDDRRLAAMLADWSTEAGR